jgi:UDP-N-acetylmuramyl pentapeptide phosphotransferase/UDP-N-acetylglucosamine-1-phosphate transferase
LGCALVGLAIVSLHWIGFERKHIESQWKWYSSMVFAILAFLVFNMLPELRPL